MNKPCRKRTQTSWSNVMIDVNYRPMYLVLQNSENLKDHPTDYSTGIISVVDNNYNFYRYLDNESHYFCNLGCFYPSKHD